MAMQRNYFTVLFFLKKSKLLKNGEAPICMRITINGKRAEVQIKRSIDVTKWNTQKECAIGREKKYQEINHYLDTIIMENTLLPKCCLKYSRNTIRNIGN